MSSDGALLGRRLPRIQRCLPRLVLVLDPSPAVLLLRLVCAGWPQAVEPGRCPLRPPGLCPPGAARESPFGTSLPHALVQRACTCDSCRLGTVARGLSPRHSSWEHEATCSRGPAQSLVAALLPIIQVRSALRDCARELPVLVRFVEAMEERMKQAAQASAAAEGTDWGHACDPPPFTRVPPLKQERPGMDACNDICSLHGWSSAGSQPIVETCSWAG